MTYCPTCQNPIIPNEPMEVYCFFCRTPCRLKNGQMFAVRPGNLSPAEIWLNKLLLVKPK